MATTTENYGFKKPATTDFYNVQDQNDNWDECDAQLKNLDNEKAASNHNHNGTYATPQDLENLTASDVGAAAANHNHDGVYAVEDHDHTGVYSPVNHNHDSAYSATSHNHNGVYSPTNHDHSGIYSPTNHNHSGVYSPENHNHSGVYAPNNHTQSASTITAGTFAGNVVAPAGTDYTINRIRNAVILPKANEPTDGASSPYANGTIVFVKKS